MDPLARQELGHLAEVQGRAGEAVEAGNHEGIALAHIVEAGAELGPGGIRAAGLLFKELFAGRQAVTLHRQVLILYSTRA